MCPSALRMRTEGGPRLEGPLSEHHEMQQLRTRAAGKGWAAWWLAAHVYGWARVCERKWEKLNHPATAESLALLLVGCS